MMTKIGRAYGFFEYHGPENIAGKLEIIKHKVKSPEELNLNLGSVDNRNTKDSALIEITDWVIPQAMNYVLEASLPNSDNRTAAKELGDVLNGICGCFYANIDDFHSRIIYKRGQMYVFRRK